MKMVRVGVDDGRTGGPLVDGGGGRLEAGAPRVEAAGSIGAAIERQLMPEQIDDWTIVLLEAIEAPPAS